jgi:hypothetical protein
MARRSQLYDRLRAAGKAQKDRARRPKPWWRWRESHIPRLFICQFQPFGNVTISHIAMECYGTWPIYRCFFDDLPVEKYENGDFPIATLNYNFGGYLVCNAADKGPQKECMRCSDFQREFWRWHTWFTIAPPWDVLMLGHGSKSFRSSSWSEKGSIILLNHSYSADLGQDSLIFVPHFDIFRPRIPVSVSHNMALTESQDLRLVTLSLEAKLDSFTEVLGEVVTWWLAPQGRSYIFYYKTSSLGILHFWTHIYIYTPHIYIYMHLLLFIHLCTCLYVCICLYVYHRLVFLGDEQIKHLDNMFCGEWFWWCMETRSLGPDLRVISKLDGTRCAMITFASHQEANHELSLAGPSQSLKLDWGDISRFVGAEIGLAFYILSRQREFTVS